MDATAFDQILLPCPGPDPHPRRPARFRVPAGAVDDRGVGDHRAFLAVLKPRTTDVAAGCRYDHAPAPTSSPTARPGGIGSLISAAHLLTLPKPRTDPLNASMVWNVSIHVELTVWRTAEHQSVRRRQWQLSCLGQRRGATQPVAGLRRCSCRLAGGLWRSGPRCVPITSNRTGLIYGREVCARGWRGV
jgi:hypothetical protein